MAKDKRNIYAEVTDKMIAALAKGVVPWQKPWVGGASAPRNLQSGKHYRGINALLLALSGYGDPRWSTFKGIKALDGNVRKGEKATLVTLWKRLEVPDPDNPGEKKIILFLKHFNVFNVEQCDFPEGVVKPIDTTVPDEFDPIAEAEAVMEGYFERPDAPTLTYGGNRACYAPALHAITLPERDQFKTAEGFYSTSYHEMAHSTGHPTMLKREFGDSFGKAKYAAEELIAEMTAAFVCASVGIDGQFDQSAAYIKGWLKALKNDEKMVVQAAGKAQKAADLILGYNMEEPPSEVNPEAIKVEDTEEVPA